MVKLYLIFVLLAISAVIVGSRWLPIWAAALVVPGSVIFFIWLTWRLIRHWFRAMMAGEIRKASMVMQGAVVSIHRVEPAVAPADFIELTEEEKADGDVDAPDRWVAIEMTVRPDPASVEAARATDYEDAGCWQPTQFTLVPPGAETNPLNRGIMAMWTGLQGAAVKAERVDGGAMVPPGAGGDEHLDDDPNLDRLAPATGDAITPAPDDAADADLDEFMIEGEARVRVLFAIPADLPAQVSLRYLTVDLAEVTLPDFGATAAP